MTLIKWGKAIAKRSRVNESARGFRHRPLSKAARVFDLPVVLSTVETKSFSGYMWPQIQAIFPDYQPIERSSMNSWDDKNFVNAIEKTGRKKIVLTGLWTETCVAYRRFRPFTTVTKSTWPKIVAVMSVSSRMIMR